MKNNIRIPQLTVAIIIVLLIIAYYIPIKVPHTVKTKGKIFPAKEWLLVKGTDGRLMTTLNNNIKGINENYSVTQFERGDAIEFNLTNQIQSGSKVGINDTIGMIYSNETEKELVDLRSELAVESALLQVNLSTEKEAIVKSEEQRVEYAKKQLDEQQKLFRRQKALFEKNLISQEEFDVASGAVELFRINVDIATERLKTVTTGAKVEEIDLIKSKIEGLKDQIDILERKFSDFVIQSPVDGVVRRVFSSDTLIVISDTTEFVGVFPINISELKSVKIGQTVTIDNPYISGYSVGKVMSIDNGLRSVNQNQYFIITVLFESNSNTTLMPGLVVEGKIECENRMIGQYIDNFLTSLLK